MPNKAFLNLSLFYAIYDQIRPFHLLVASNDLDAAPFLIRRKKRENSLEGQESPRLKHSVKCLFDFSKSRRATGATAEGPHISKGIRIEP